MKKIVAALVILATFIATPAHAWYRGGYGWRGPVYNNYNYYGGWGRGYGYGGWGNYGAALGIGAGAALLGGVIGGAIASQPYYGSYGYGYYCRNIPAYDAWGRFIGYTC